MNNEQERDGRNPRVRLGPLALKYVLQEAAGEKPQQDHLEEAFLKLQAKADATQSTQVDGLRHASAELELELIKKSIERLSIETSHFRFMLLACLCPDEEALQKELEKVHDRMNQETREMLIQYGIPTKERDTEMAKFYRMQEAMRGEQETEMEEER